MYMSAFAGTLSAVSLPSEKALSPDSELGLESSDVERSDSSEDSASVTLVVYSSMCI